MDREVRAFIEHPRADDVLDLVEQRHTVPERKINADKRRAEGFPDGFDDLFE